MKGGSITKILLEVIFSRAIHEAYGIPFGKFVSETSGDIIDAFHTAYRETYKITREIGSIISLAGESLKAGGHIYYVSEQDTFGILGMIDASECPPTYGAKTTDVVGFVAGGLGALQMRDGVGLEDVKISFEDFACSQGDTVVVLHLEEKDLSEEVLKIARRAKGVGKRSNTLG